MRRLKYIPARLVALIIGVILLSCGHDNTVVPGDRSVPVEDDEGAALFEWALGPIAGITTAWHAVPTEITVPVGTTLRLKCGGSRSADIQWNNAKEVSRGDLGSIAECHIEAPGRHEIRAVLVSSTSEGPGTKDDDPSRHTSVVHSCIVTGIMVGVDQVGVVSLEPRVTPLTLTESSSNYETMKAFLTGGEHNQEISQLRRVGPGHYRTAVNRYVALGATLVDPRFASLIETRITGERPALGVETIHLGKPGPHAVSVGPPAKAISFDLDTYKVTITSHQKGKDFVRDGEPMTFVAQTDPTGHEDEITWISSTKYGEAHPVVGHGPKFTVTFQGTSRRDSWLGVRADNAVFGQDAPTPPGPICAVTPTSLLFGCVSVGLSKDLSFTIENNGGGTLTGNVNEGCSDYSIVSGGGGFSLGSGQSVVVTIRFSPASAGGPINCSVDTGTGDCPDVGCTGNGVAGQSFGDDFEDADFSDWTVGCGAWAMSAPGDGFGMGRAVVCQSAAGTLLHSSLARGSGHYHFDFYLPPGANGAHAGFEFQKAGNSFYWLLTSASGAGDTADRLMLVNGGGPAVRGCAPVVLPTGWNQIDVYRFPSGVIQVYRGTGPSSTLLLEAKDTNLDCAGGIVLQAYGAGVRFDNIMFDLTMPPPPPDPSPQSCGSYNTLPCTEPCGPSGSAMQDGFESGNLDDWITRCGSWTIVTPGHNSTHAIRSGSSASCSASECRLDHACFQGSAGIYSYDVMFPAGAFIHDGDLLIEVVNSCNFNWFFLGPVTGDNQRENMLSVTNNAATILACGELSLTTGIWYTIRVERYANGVIRVYEDNVLKMEGYDPTVTTGTIALRASTCGVLFDNVSFNPSLSGNPQQPGSPCNDFVTAPNLCPTCGQ